MNEVTPSKLAEDFKVLINDVEGLVKATAGEASERVADLRQHLARKIEEGRKALAERKSTWLHGSDEPDAGAESRTCDRAWVAVGIATGVGLLVGLLLRRK
jgi:ElaB/YqjD/DUF883 family membrane-anchored ribosome-binding protein